jgi:hypothetical protein
MDSAQVSSPIVRNFQDLSLYTACKRNAKRETRSRAELKVYPGASHGICSTLKNAVNEDLLAFLAPDRVAVA